MSADNNTIFLPKEKNVVTKWKLIAGQEMLLEFCLDIYSINDPVICIWHTELPPDLEEAIREGIEPEHFFAIDNVKLYSKEHLHSLFFPKNFILNEWNLVLAGIKEDATDLQSPMHTSTGMLRGWMMGTDIEKYTLDMENNLFSDEL